MAKLHTLQPGEDAPLLAARFKLASWKKIWDHADNATLKAKRGDPSLLHPGDRLFIPDPQPKQAGSGSDQKHRFKKLGDKVTLRLVMQDRDGQPISGRPWEIVVGNDVVASGSTGGDGKIEEKFAATVDDALLRFWPDAALPDLVFKWRLKPGHLSHIDEVRGVQGRLRNLGYPCGPVDGIVGANTREATRQFQKTADLPETGEVDDATRQKLLEQHDQG